MLSVGKAIASKDHRIQEISIVIKYSIPMHKADLNFCFEMLSHNRPAKIQKAKLVAFIQLQLSNYYTTNASNIINTVNEHTCLSWISHDYITTPSILSRTYPGLDTWVNLKSIANTVT